MKVDVPQGNYVLAVSGGVDSMVLLDILSKTNGVELVIAHLNHGMRLDSEKDEVLVGCAAQKYGLPIEVGHARLGKNTSEEQARAARYEFLNKVKNKYKAQAIVTAHHQDDLLETAFINILRGTGYKGLVSIINNQNVLRPLLIFTKKDVLKYAQANRIVWHEDSTNTDTSYLRNYIRLLIMPRLTLENRNKILQNIKKVAKNSTELSGLNATISQMLVKDEKIDRSFFALLPHETGKEIIAFILSQKKVMDIDKKTIERLSLAIKTAQPGTTHDVKGKTLLEVEKTSAYFTS